MQPSLQKVNEGLNSNDIRTLKVSMVFLRNPNLLLVLIVSANGYAKREKNIKEFLMHLVVTFEGTKLKLNELTKCR